MTNYFLDSSALVKHYHAEAGTAEVDRLLAEPNARHFIARLTTVEVGLQIGMEQFWSLRDFSFPHKQLRDVSLNGPLLRHFIKRLKAIPAAEKMSHLAISKKHCLINLLQVNQMRQGLPSTPLRFS